MTDIDLDVLPTHLAQVLNRVDLSGDDSADTFLAASYVAEAAIKTIAIALRAGLRCASPENAYALAFRLLHSDGLGSWHDAISQIASQSLAAYLPRDFHTTLEWLTKRRPEDDDGVLPAIRLADKVLTLCEAEPRPEDRRRSVRQLLARLVAIRNKTKAHGAHGPDFFESACRPYREAVLALVRDCPLFQAEWMFLSTRVGKSRIRGTRLSGLKTKYMRDSETEGLSLAQPGIYVRIREDGRLVFVGDLIRTTLECREFFIPNGSCEQNGTAEFIDYATGHRTRIDISEYQTPPAPLPQSETAGLPTLEIQSDLFGNLPAPPPNYVQRRTLQEQLAARLRDRNHHIITLHGRGGIGKTSLALRVAHDLAAEAPTPFDSILWFSGRDVDLRLSGPSSVRKDVWDLKSICTAFGRLLQTDETEEALAKRLHEPADVSGKGTLFVFDNFETLDASNQVYVFLDTHACIPNKVLITSRERAFKADYPIEVRGMDHDEAAELCRRTARELSIEGLVTDNVISSVYDATDGHPYVMRVILGEMAKEGRFVAPKSLIPQRQDIVHAVFERSFNKLSPEGRWVFSLVANWHSAVPELALLMVCVPRELDAESGIDECRRLSLIIQEEYADGSFCYWAPELARLFGRRKLESDEDRLAIQEDLELLRRCGTTDPRNVSSQSPDAAMKRFIEWISKEAKEADRSRAIKLDGLLSSLAARWPRAWADVARFRAESGFDRLDVARALRNLVEERPFDKEAWLLRMQYARQWGDDSTAIAALMSAVDADPSDVELVREAAFQLVHFLDVHKLEIPRRTRGVYLAGIRAHMERVANKLDATGLSRLAWLFLLEDNKQVAYEYAVRGAKLDPANEHCKNLIERLERSGSRQEREHR